MNAWEQLKSKKIRPTLTYEQAELLKNTLQWVTEKSGYGMTIKENESMLSLIRQLEVKLN